MDTGLLKEIWKAPYGKNMFTYFCPYWAFQISPMSTHWGPRYTGLLSDSTNISLNTHSGAQAPRAGGCSSSE